LQSTVVFFVRMRPPPRSTLFPYTTLFRSSPLETTRGRPLFRPAPVNSTRFLPNTQRSALRGPTGDRLGNPVRRVDRSGNKPDRKDRKSTRLNSSHVKISYAVFCLKKQKNL